MFGDDLADGLAELREHAVSMMRDQCVIERQDGDPVLDDETLQYVPAWVPVYDGRCRVQVSATQPAEAKNGGRVFVVTDAVVQLPVDATDYRDGDRVTITEASYDPALDGVVLSVTSREVKTHATMRRLHVSEVR